MFRAFMCPSSGENCCIYVTNTSVLQIQQFSPDDRHMNARNMKKRQINKCIKQNCASRWIYLQGLYKDAL